MNNHKQIKQDLVQDIIDLINQYNYTKELATIMTRNFNEIDPNPAENETCGVGERDPHKLHNKISNQVAENLKEGIVSEKIDSKNFPEKISKPFLYCDKSWNGEESLTMVLTGIRECDIWGTKINPKELFLVLGRKCHHGHVWKSGGKI